MAGDEELASGHRARLRERLLRQGPDALLDHEIVEYLLALVMPRRDTKPMAKQMLNAFGGIGGLFAADAETIERAGFTETQAAAVKIVNAAVLRVLAAEVKARPVLSGWAALTDYLRADMAHRPVERVRVLFLDAKNMLIRDEAMSNGTVSEAAIYVREVIRRAIDLHASALILVHNHPSGDPKPSRQDIAVTRDVVEAGKRLGIVVHDHVIVGGAECSSMRAQGLM